MHRKLLIGLAIASCLQGPVFAQVLTGDRAVQYGDITVPAFQAKPPAGHNDIAFRPSCWQLTPINQANGLVGWSIFMPDGVTRVLYELPRDEPDPLGFLGNAGICKTGRSADGVIEVPLIYSHQLPQTAVAQVETAGVVDPSAAAFEQGERAVTVEGGKNRWMIGIGAVLILAVITWNAISYVRFRMANPMPKAKAQSSAEGKGLTALEKIAQTLGELDN